MWNCETKNSERHLSVDNKSKIVSDSIKLLVYGTNLELIEAQFHAIVNGRVHSWPPKIFPSVFCRLYVILCTIFNTQNDTLGYVTKETVQLTMFYLLYIIIAVLSLMQSRGLSYFGRTIQNHPLFIDRGLSFFSLSVSLFPHTYNAISIKKHYVLQKRNKSHSWLI